jgi:hypothetical protein
VAFCLVAPYEIARLALRKTQPLISGNSLLARSVVRQTSGHVELAAGSFNLSMRLYGPQTPVLNGSCRLPSVERFN